MGLPIVSFGQGLTMDVDTLAELINRNFGTKFGPAARQRSVMPFESCHVEYGLTRRQRLMAHLGVWTPFLMMNGLMAVGGLVAIIVLEASVSPWLALILIIPLWLGRRFIAGIFQMILVHVHHIDVIIDENDLRYETKGGGWIFGGGINLDAIVQIDKYSRDTWTLLASNGLVISIPVDAIESHYIDHIRAKTARG